MKNKIEDLAEVAKAALEYIDGIPTEVADAFPTIPGFDRDWAEEVISSAPMSYQQLAAENVALKAFVGECAIAQGEGNWTSDVEKTIYVPATEWMPPTPATDRIVAGIKADGVALIKSAFEEHIQSPSCYQDEVVGMESALSIASQVESQLREGLTNEF